MCLASEQLSKVTPPSIQVVDTSVAVKTEQVGHFGSLLDSQVNMSGQVTKTIKAVIFNLSNIGRPRNMLAVETTTKLVLSIVRSRRNSTVMLFCVEYKIISWEHCSVYTIWQPV